MKIATCTRILDEMPEVQLINCTSDRLDIILMPNSDVDLVSREFQQGCVVAGGVEWQCETTGTLVPAAFTRKVRGVSIQGNPLRIELNTSDCEPFEAFEDQDIDIWSEDVVTSSDQSSHVRTQDPTTQSATRGDYIDTDTEQSKTNRIRDELLLLDTTHTKISFVYDLNFHLTFRFKLRAGTDWGVPTLFEFESWVREQNTLELKVKAQSQLTYSAVLRKSVVFPVFAVPLTIAGIGVDLGFFGTLTTEARTNMGGKFSGEIGIRMSRAGKYGAVWEPGSSNMRPINDYSPMETEKLFEWGGKVVASVKPSIELQIAMRLGLSLGGLIELGFEIRSGLKFELQGEFKYGLGNLILPPVSTARIELASYVINQPDCEKLHEGEVTVLARIRWLGVSLTVNPFGNWVIISQRDVLPLYPLLIACSASGGVEGVTLEYERIGGGSSGTSYAEMNDSYEPPAPVSSPPNVCIVGVDCPPQPGQCANGYTGTVIGAPCSSGCGIGYSQTARCEPPTCCRANSQHPPNNGQHSEVGSGVWTSNSLTVAGGMYVEVRCNAGYELSGRNLGFQGLGNNGIGFQYTPFTSGNNPSDYRVDGWPRDSDYTPCVQVVTRRRLNPSSHKEARLRSSDTAGTRRLSPSMPEASIPRRAHQDNRLTSEIVSVRGCQNYNVGGNQWVDSHEDSCSDYTSSPHWCAVASNYKNMGYDATEICCVCGGGASTSSGGSSSGGSSSSGGTSATYSPDPSCRFSQSIPAPGSWSLEERTCTPISCGSYPSVSYGTIAPAGVRTLGQTVTITCNAGFTLTGDNRFSATPACQDNGQFTSGKLCARSTCGSFPEISHGEAFPSSGVVSGQHLLITCDEGYEVSGDSSLLCESGVYQITNQPSCHRISCGSLQVANGRAVPSTDILFGNKAEIHCNAGYFLSQQSAGSQAQAECTAYGVSPFLRLSA